jgi:UDP-N-acetylglucosamine acyltransferase
MTTHIHPTAIIEKGAELDDDVVIEAYSIVGPHVKIGKGTRVHSHVVIHGHTTIGCYNEIYHYAAVGNPPQDLKYKGEPTTLVIGDKNLIREFTTLQPGTVQGIGTTTVGNENLIMAYCHVAHDCVVGNQNVMANCTQLAGHVTVHNMTVLGGMTAIHQFVHIGNMAMTGGGSMISKDLPPFCIAEGNRASLRGLNVVALQRRGMNSEERAAVKTAYRAIFLENHPTLDVALSHIEEGIKKHAPVAHFIEFIQSSKRGVMRPSLEQDDSPNRED